MPGGLQCWDAAGKLVVDIGDYNTRYLGRTTANFDGTVKTMTLPYSGSSLSGCFAVITEAKSNSPGLPNAEPSEYAARTLNGAILLIRVGQPKSVTLSIDVYAFI